MLIIKESPSCHCYQWPADQVAFKEIHLISPRPKPDTLDTENAEGQVHTKSEKTRTHRHISHTAPVGNTHARVGNFWEKHNNNNFRYPAAFDILPNV